MLQYECAAQCAYQVDRCMVMVCKVARRRRLESRCLRVLGLWIFLVMCQRSCLAQWSQVMCVAMRSFAVRSNEQGLISRKLV